MSSRSNRTHRSSHVLAFAAAALLSICSVAAHAAIPATERQALLDLYQSTRGNGWTNKSGWNGVPGTECSWYGITCNAAKTHVTMVSLSGNNLRGYLPPSLPYLTRLQSFYATYNPLSGSLPRLGAFRFMRIFEVGGSSSDIYMSGTLPRLPPSIETFFAAAQRFTGSIPPLSGLPKLKEFLVQLNQLSGPIPTLPASIERFYANSNQLTGPIPPLAELGNLKEFVVAYNQLTGPVPDLRENGKLLYFLALRNELTGDIPPLASSSLQSYDVSFNHLTGQIPSLEGVPSLSAFGAGGNQLTGGIPQLQASPNLLSIYVSENQLTGSIPDLSGLQHLQIASFSANRLTGSIPSLAGLSQLMLFDVSANLLTGSIPALNGLSALDTFDVSSNQLTGGVPSLSDLHELANFFVANNKLTGVLPPPPSPNRLQSGHSSLCPNYLQPTPSFEWDQIVGSPWYWNCTTPAMRRRVQSR